LAALKNRREQIQSSLRRADAAADREALLRPSGAPSTSAPAPPRETPQTAPLSERGLLQLQQQVMRAQDIELDHIERAVANTKHVATAIGEEVDLQTRLLEEVEEGVGSAHERLRAAARRAREVARATRSDGCKGGAFIFLLVVILTFLLMVVFKIIRLFG
jgi:SYP5 family syntaxin